MKKRYLFVSLILILFISGCEDIKESPLFSKQINIKEVFDVEEIFSIKDSDELVLTGNIETIIFDDFENLRSQELYYLVTENKRYKINLIEGEKPLYYFNTVSIRGKIDDDEIIVDSAEKDIIQLPAPLKDFDYSWSGVVGEQKYLAVVLRSPDQQLPINLDEKINNLSQLLNTFFIDLSNNRMFFSIDYYGVVDVPQVEMQDANLELLFSPEELDEINISNYKGIMFFGDYLGAYAGLRTYNPDGSINKYGNTYTSLILIDNTLFDNGTAIAHELGHTFGLGHSGWLRCGNYPNRDILGNICRYSPYYDPQSIMGSGYLTGREYNLRNLLEVLKWIDQENVPTVNEGTYFISPLNTPLISGEIQGLKIPINWNISNVTVFIDYTADQNSFYGINYSLESYGTNFYYIEYRTNIFSFNYGLGDYSEMHKGILIRLGSNRTMRDCNMEGDYCSNMQETLLLSMHPNSRYCDYSNDPINPFCLDLGQDYAFLEEGETYLDKFNKMNITVLETNESGALVKISPYYFCGDNIIQNLNSDGQIEECDDGNKINTDDCTNECKLAKPNDGICWEGKERCGECCYEGNCFECDDCIGYRGSVANCAENKICLEYSPTGGSNTPSCVVACSSNLLAGCYHRECPREYDEITGYEADMTDPLVFSCFDLDPNQEYHEETWFCCESSYEISPVPEEDILPEPPKPIVVEKNIFEKFLGWLF